MKSFLIISSLFLSIVSLGQNNDPYNQASRNMQNSTRFYQNQLQQNTYNSQQAIQGYVNQANQNINAYQSQRLQSEMNSDNREYQQQQLRIQEEDLRLRQQQFESEKIRDDAYNNKKTVIVQQPYQMQEADAAKEMMKNALASSLFELQMKSMSVASNSDVVVKRQFLQAYETAQKNLIFCKVNDIQIGKADEVIEKITPLFNSIKVEIKESDNSSLTK